MLNKDSSGTLFSHPLLLSGISSIIIFEIQNRLVLLKNKIFKFIRPSPNSTFNVHNLHGIRLLARLRVGLSHLREHKFRQNLLRLPRHILQLRSAYWNYYSLLSPLLVIFNTFLNVYHQGYTVCNLFLMFFIFLLCISYS